MLASHNRRLRRGRANQQQPSPKERRSHIGKATTMASRIGGHNLGFEKDEGGFRISPQLLSHVLHPNLSNASPQDGLF